jgi:uncharacterized protein YbjQ (UPF0145 family)
MAFRPSRNLSLTCVVCGNDFEVPQGYSGGMTCPACVGLTELDREAFHVSTGDCPADWRLIETLGIVGAEYVAGVSAWSEFLASFPDYFGGRSEELQKILREARRSCIEEVSAEARTLGANAVVGLRINYAEIGSGQSFMLLVSAVGTSARVERA